MPSVAVQAICPKCKDRFDWPKMYQLAEVAAITGVTLQTVRAWINTGVLKTRVKYLGKGRAMLQLVDSYQLAEFLDLRYPVRDELAMDPVNELYRRRRRVNRESQARLVAARRA